MSTKSPNFETKLATTFESTPRPEYTFAVSSIRQTSTSFTSSSSKSSSTKGSYSKSHLEYFFYTFIVVFILTKLRRAFFISICVFIHACLVLRYYNFCKTLGILFDLICTSIRLETMRLF